MNPEKQNGTASNGPAPETQRHHAAGTAEYIRGLRRRREATHRMPAADCGCRDPWTCRHPLSDTVTEQYVTGYADAARHLLAAGMTPPPNLPAMRAMWRRGGDDQRLAMHIAERWQVPA